MKLNSLDHFKFTEELLSLVAWIDAGGFTAWLAGGAVRDLLMGRTPNDFDVVTSATPDQLQEWCARSLTSIKLKPVGKAFGVLIAVVEGQAFDVASFRKDVGSSDGRHPDAIEWGTPEEDAARRDFTVNALFYDFKNKKLIDFVGGIKDIEAQILRCVGEPLLRLQEDHLRVLRAYRQSAQLGFAIESQLKLALSKSSALLLTVSHERVLQELEKFFSAKERSDVIPLLLANQALQILFPEIQWSLSTYRQAPNPWIEFLVWANRAAKPEVSFAQILKKSWPIKREIFDFALWIEQIFQIISGVAPAPRLGLLIEKLFNPDSQQALEFVLADPAQVSEILARALNLAKKLDSRPEPRARAADFPELKGAELGQRLKELWYQQLEGS